MKKLFFVMIFLLVNLEASVDKTKDLVFNIAKTYASVVACDTTFEVNDGSKNMNNIIFFSKDGEEEVYLVLWGGDVGCEGGSGTSSFYLSEISRYSSYRPFLLKNINVLNVLNINFRAILSVKKISDNFLELVGLDYKEDDPNCCPSLKFKYIVKYENFSWKLIDKSLLETIKY